MKMLEENYEFDFVVMSLKTILKLKLLSVQYKLRIPTFYCGDPWQCLSKRLEHNVEML